MNEKQIFKLAEELADEVYGKTGQYLYSERQELTSKFNVILLNKLKTKCPKCNSDNVTRMNSNNWCDDCGDVWKV